MLRRRYGTFAGGIDLPDEKHLTADLAIGASPALSRLVLPLAPPGRPAARLLVSAGDHVKAGQLIAQAQSPDQIDIHAPLAGRIGDPVQAQAAGVDGFEPVDAVELVDLSDASSPDQAAPTVDWRSLDADALARRLEGGGLTTCRLDHVPLARWVNRARAAGVPTLIANAVEHQPYVTCRHRLLCEHGQEVVRGLALLGQAIGARQVVLAVDGRRTGDYSHLVGLAMLLGITRVALPSKYPIGADAILVKVLTRREAPVGGDPIDAGAAVVDVACCRAAYRWVACQEPLTRRLVTLAGERLGGGGNVWLPIGAVCSDVIARPQWPLIHSDAMTGVHCTDEAVIGPASDALLAIQEAVPAHPSPCIRCSWCTDNCPARLNVAMLNDAFELGLVDRAIRRGVRACVECGLCSYLCPARLPLSQRVIQLKRLAAEARA